MVNKTTEAVVIVIKKLYCSAWVNILTEVIDFKIRQKMFVKQTNRLMNNACRIHQFLQNIEQNFSDFKFSL